MTSAALQREGDLLFERVLRNCGGDVAATFLELLKGCSIPAVESPEFQRQLAAELLTAMHRTVGQAPITADDIIN